MVINNTVNIYQTDPNVQILNTAPLSDLVNSTMPTVNTDNPSIPVQNIILSNSKPDVVESCNDVEKPFKQDANTTEAKKPDPATNLIAALSPDKFTLEGPSSDNKKTKKITKADFFKNKTSLAENSDPDDPFGNIDPLWGYKNKK